MNTTATTMLLSFALLTPGDEPAPKFPLGTDTTRVTGPLDKEGYIDYQSALNDMLGKGIKPENNANVLLWKALGPTPEGGKGMPAEFFKRLGIEEPPASGQYFIRLTPFLRDQLKLEPPSFDELNEIELATTRRPWKAKEYPNVAAWLEANEKPLALVIDATRLPEYFNPIVSDGQYGSVLSVRLPGAQSCRALGTALVTRAMLRVANSEFDAAWQDLLAAHRLGRLVARGATLVEALAGFTINNIAATADLSYLQHTKLNAAKLRERSHDLEQLPPLPSVAEKIGNAERFTCLESVQFVRRFGLGFLEGLSGGKMDKASEKELTILASIDWTPGLKSVNRWYDRLAATADLKTRAEREAEFDKIGKDLQAIRSRAEDLIVTITKIKLGSEPADKSAAGKDLGDSVVLLLLPGAGKVQTSLDRTEQTQRNLHLAFALAAFHSDNGRYPAKLSELAPKYLATVPDDLFSGQPLIYRLTESGYLLYSVGPNGKDDAGHGRDDDPPADDLAVQSPLPELKKK